MIFYCTLNKTTTILREGKEDRYNGKIVGTIDVERDKKLRMWLVTQRKRENPAPSRRSGKAERKLLADSSSLKYRAV